MEQELLSLKAFSSHKDDVTSKVLFHLQAAKASEKNFCHTTY